MVVIVERPVRGEAVKPTWRRALERGIRFALPALASRGSEDWNIGGCTVPAVLDGSVVRDLQLSWRLVEQQRSEAARATGNWRLEGHALVMDLRVDFRGACWRDLRSGALIRFDLDCVGGPRES